MTEQAKGPTKRGVTRYQVLTGCFFVALAVIFIQLFHIQIIDHEMYAKQADAMQTDKQTINAARGEIYVRDTDGNIAPLVMNKTVYTLFADPSSIEDVDEARELVERVAGDSLIDGSVDKLSDDELQYVVLAKRYPGNRLVRLRKPTCTAWACRLTRSVFIPREHWQRRY